MRMFMGSIRDGNVGRLKELLAEGVPPDGEFDYLPLYAAACSDTPNSAEIVRVLLEAGADPCGEEALYASPFPIFAATRPDVVRVLLEAGVDPNLRDSTGNTPLLFTPQHNDNPGKAAEIVRVLLEAGADPRAENSNSETPLHTAANAEICRLLLEAGADPGARDWRGRTPLHEAVAWSLGATVAPLLEAGADPGARDARGRTPGEVWNGYGAETALAALAAFRERRELSVSVSEGRSVVRNRRL